ncbi:MAG: hypothetical protein EOM87_05510 [Clostridia bacterium]|nr:hypothetical protein [Clostridia bacterium]
MSKNTKKKCLIIVNRRSGNSSKINRKTLLKRFGTDCSVTLRFIDHANDNWSAEGYNRLVICGGDGTFNNALNNIKGQNIEVFYCPCGTLNEFSKTIKQQGSCVLQDAGIINNRIFSYVAATGSFTPLGYVVSEKHKKRYKSFAYYLKVIREYKVHNILANIVYNDKIEEGNFTLIMALDSMRCFGFRFNKMYKPDDQLLHLLLIRSPGEDTVLNRMKMFFSFFRVFFIGFRKAYRSKNIIFEPVKSMTITLKREESFCIDGEKVIESGKIDIGISDLDSQITVLGKIAK